MAKIKKSSSFSANYGKVEQVIDFHEGTGASGGLNTETRFFKRTSNTANDRSKEQTLQVSSNMRAKEGSLKGYSQSKSSIEASDIKTTLDVLSIREGKAMSSHNDVVGVEMANRREKNRSAPSDFQPVRTMPAHNANRPTGKYIDQKELSNRVKETLAAKSDPDSVNFDKNPRPTAEDADTVNFRKKK